MLAKTLAFAALALLASAEPLLEGARSAYSRAQGKSVKYTNAAHFPPALGKRSSPTPLKTTPHTFGLEKVSTIKSDLGLVSLNNETFPLYAGLGGADFALNVGVDDQDFYLVFDTGSSDTWVPGSDFICANASYYIVDQSECAFGATFDLTAPGASNATIEGEYFFILYGSGEFVYGSLSNHSVSIGDINVPQQEMSIASQASWTGDNFTSGLMGFGYPSITNALNSTTYDNEYYNPWIFNVFGQNSTDSDAIAPVFSLALDYNISTGVSGSLGIGGLPENVDYTGDFVSTDILIADLQGDNITATNYSFYTIAPDGFVIKPSSPASTETFVAWAEYAYPSAYVDGTLTLASSAPAIVDSGTSLTYLPPVIASLVNAAFDPPGVYNALYGLYEVTKDAVPPYVAVVIEGTEFQVSAEGLLPSYGFDDTTGLSFAGIQSNTGIGLTILGDTFLTGVVTVFDIGASQMRFAVRA